MRLWMSLAVTAAALSACAPKGERAAPRALKLERCRMPGVSAQVQCGTWEVYEDRAAREGRKLKLHVAVVPAVAARGRPDPLFILAGGPGQAASDTAAVLLPALEKVRRTRDIVFVDQRGTGKSAPLECELAPRDASLSQRLAAEFDPEAVRRCRAELEREHDLRLYGTTLAMDDLDEVRRALGYQKINLWGGSYGTRAALVYLRQHPEAVRTAILDGVAPMALYLPKDMAKDAQRSLDFLFAACEADAQCRARYPGLRARFLKLLDTLGRTPAQATVPHPRTGVDEQVTIGRESFTRMLRALLYRPEATTLVPLTIDHALAGDWRPFVGQAELLDNGFAQQLSVGMFLSVVCTEDVPFIDLAAAREEAGGTFVGPGFADELARACALWPRGEVPAGYREPVRSEVPVLLFSGELDPVTPPRWGEEAHRHLPNSRHIAVPATGHGTLGNACVRRQMEQFLDSGSVEGLTARCDEGSRTPFFTSFAGPPP